MSQSFDPNAVMIRDAHPLARAFGDRRSLDDKLERRWRASTERVEQRRRDLPEISFPAELPISQHIDEFIEALQQHPVVVVAGETGSGKTTQIPKACLAAGYGVRGMIGHTQPRRLAARTVAKRIAEELEVELGDAVGYAVRFSDRSSDDTYIRVMTDGLLLAEIRSDRYLNSYEVLIIDEAHERSLNVDFLIGYVKSLLRRRRDLKVVITSATIDVDAFAAHFDGAPVIEVSGRGYPVDVCYDDGGIDETSRLSHALSEIAAKRGSGPRDVLMFQSGEREILETSRWLKQEFGEKFEVLPLYARLPTREQQRIFERGSRQRIVLATNVAETSITVPNIGYVIDPGFARISRYSFRSKLQRLPIEPISQASADQRKGRCGRIAPGVCYRLYAEDDFLSRPAYTDPELKRTNLAAVVLQMRAFRLGEIERFPFIDPPDPRVVRDAGRLLHELGALVDDKLTAVGRTMARLPIDPRLARMIIAAAKTGALTEVLIIVSALAVQDPRVRPLDRQQAADESHREFIDPDSDFMSFVNLWRWCEQNREDLTRNAYRRLLEKRFIGPNRVREWRELHRQLLLTTRELGMKLNGKAADFASIHRALLTGSLGFIGLKDEKGEYLGARGLKFRIFPGSGLAKRSPKWVVAAEIAETERTYARCIATVEARWIEESAPHLIKRSHSEPHWNDKRGEVLAFERAVLYGLPVVERRPVPYAKIDPVVCQEIFVAEALVKPSKQINAPFLQHNQNVIRAVLDAQAKQRRADLLVRDDVLAAFYIERLPADVSSVQSMNAWQRRASAESIEHLHMTPEDVLTRLDAVPSADDFPSRIHLDGMEFPLKYTFAPGEPDDGVSIRIGLGTLSHVRQDALEWLVPGFFEQKCVELIKSLPKQIRKRLAPVPDNTRQLLPVLSRTDHYRNGKLLVALAERIEAEFGVHVGIEDWQLEQLPPFLRMNVQVIDERRRVVTQGRDLEELKRSLFERVERQMEGGLRDRHEQSGLTRFPEQGVQQKLIVGNRRNGQSVTYPVLEDRLDHVDLALRSHQVGQAKTNRRGYSRLALLADAKTTRYLKKQFADDLATPLLYATLGSKADLLDELLRAAAWESFFAGSPLPTSAAEFEAAMAAGRPRMVEVFEQLLAACKTVLEERFAVAKAVAELNSPAFEVSRADVTDHLARLVPADFLNRFSLAALQELPRYLRGIAHRIANLQGRVTKDRDNIAAITPWENRLAALGNEMDDEPELTEARLAVEEYRVALFAQRVGTRGKVSEQRLGRLIEPLERRVGLR